MLAAVLGPEWFGSDMQCTTAEEMALNRKVKFQLLQTLMSSQPSFKFLQLKAILCFSILQYMRWLVSDPCNLCSLHNACKVTGKVETYPLFTKAADETHIHKWMQLDGNGEHESVGTNMGICSPRKSTKCEKCVGYTNVHTTWVDQTVWETLYMEHAAFSHCIQSEHWKIVKQ